MKNKAPDVIVHLVHGTWPFGIFGRRKGQKLAWFENGSGTLESFVPRSVDVEFMGFSWSGKNSPTARGEAAYQLMSHLQTAIENRPNSPHVIVAHSHGGTVAAHALSMVEPNLIDGKVRALICMATPFAYIAKIGEEKRKQIIKGISFCFLLFCWCCYLVLSG